MSTPAVLAEVRAGTPADASGQCPRGCGRPSRREPGSYCTACHAAYEAARRRAGRGWGYEDNRVYIRRPEPVLVIDGQAWLSRPPAGTLLMLALVRDLSVGQRTGEGRAS